MKTVKCCLLLFWVVQSCAPKAPEQPADNRDLVPALVALTVQNLDSSANWYAHLGFERDTTMNFPDYDLRIALLSLEDFQLELVEFEDAIKVDKSLLPESYSNLHGFIKIGFLTDSIEHVVSTLTGRTTTLAGPGDLPDLSSRAPWPNRFAIATDPDGNLVQFFEGDSAFSRAYVFNGPLNLAPFLVMLSMDSLDRGLSWYERALRFDTLESLRAPGNQRAIAARDGFVLEFGMFDSDLTLKSLGLDSLNYDKIIGIKKLGFKSSAMDSLYEAFRGNEIEFYFEKMDSVSTDRNFIVKDIEGNYLQFFEK